MVPGNDFVKSKMCITFYNNSLRVISISLHKFCNRIYTARLNPNFDFIFNIIFLCILQIKNLDGLSQFVALGVLVLAHNDISWFELSKICHVHTLELSLHGNPQLEKDHYCKNNCN